MKTTLKTLFLFLFVAFLGCDKEIDFETSFPFTIEENHSELSTINIGERTIFEIKPEKIVTTNKYEFRYVVNTGAGFYRDQNMEEIEQDTWVALEGLNFDFEFVGTVVGETKASVFIRDKENSSTIDITYQIQENPFSVSLNTISPVATVDEKKEFTLILSNNGEDQNVTYQAALFLSQGTGTIELLDENGEVIQIVDQNETFVITPGTYNYAVTLDNDGENILSVSVTDSNGQKNEDSIELLVNVIDFNFTGEPEKNNTSLGNDININFNIVEVDGGQDTYVVRPILENGNAELYAGPTQIFAGTNTDVPLGAFTWIFRPLEVGVVDLRFIARNGTGVEKEIVISIDVKDRSFDFTATPSLNSISLGQSLDVNFVITEEGGNQPDEYTMIYSSNLNSSLSINGISYNAGAVIPIPSLEFVTQYLGEESGDHNITFTITATSNSNEVTKSVSFEIKDRSFDFTATRNLASTPLGEPIEINYVITEQGGVDQDSYTMVYSSSNNGNLTVNGTEYSPGATIIVPSLSFTGIYVGTQPGSHRITSTITANSNGIERTKDVDVTYQASEFTFTASSSNELTVGDTIPVEFTLNEVVGNSTFDISYSITGVAQEFRNGNNFQLSPNTQYDVESNTFSWSLTAVEQGTMNVTYTVINQFGVIETQSIEYTILPIQFDFTVAPIGTNFLTNQNIRFNFNMDAPSILTYQLSFESNGTATINYNGIDYNEGQKLTVTSSDFFVRYVTQTPGSNVINWTIEASNGVIISKSSTINVDQQPSITNFIVTSSNNNNLCFIDEVQEIVLPDHEILFEKSPTASINQVTYLYRNNFGSNTFTRTVDLSLPNSSTRTGKYQAPCVQNASIVSITITDSKGFTSEPYTP